MLLASCQECTCKSHQDPYGKPAFTARCDLRWRLVLELASLALLWLPALMVCITCTGG